MCLITQARAHQCELSDPKYDVCLIVLKMIHAHGQFLAALHAILIVGKEEHFKTSLQSCYH